MRAICQIKKCEDTEIMKKVHEDWEDLIYGVCWQCGDKLNEIIGIDLLDNFQFVLGLVRENVRD